MCRMESGHAHARYRTNCIYVSRYARNVPSRTRNVCPKPCRSCPKPGGRPSEARPRICQTIRGVRTYPAKVRAHEHKPSKVRGRLKRNRAQTRPNQANCEDVSSETGPKPGQTRAKPGKLQGRLRRNRAQTRPNQGPTRQILRTSQAKPGPNQAQPGAQLGRF